MPKAKPGSRDFSHEYWRQSVPSESNRPENYLNFPQRSEYLLTIINERTRINKAARILEVGPNVGRNLARLWDEGYRRLTGVEISGPAVELMKKTYPRMYAKCEIYNCPVEEIITRFKTNEFDLVFSMAVLMHIHPHSEWVFRHVARIAETLITMDAEEGTRDNIRFPRKYRKVFEALGCKHLWSRRDGIVLHCITRVFDCRSVK